MKLTVTDWTHIQNKTNDDAEGNALYDKIERRTWGKRWSQEVSIALDKREQELADAAIAAYNASKAQAQP